MQQNKKKLYTRYTNTIIVDKIYGRFYICEQIQ